MFVYTLIFAFDVPSFLLNDGHTANFVVATNLSLGVSLLLFPVFELIADVWLTRYRMLQLSLLMLVFVLIVALIILMAGNLSFPYLLMNKYIFLPATSVLLIGVITSIGIFEANALQFGMDQLLEASSTQLSTFVHWYFWAMHLGQKLLFLIFFPLGHSYTMYLTLTE